MKGGREQVWCGLGVRAVRAGSIGRDSYGPGERTESPREEAGGRDSRPIHEEISALGFQAERTDPQAMTAPSLYTQPPFNAGNHP